MQMMRNMLRKALEIFRFIPRSDLSCRIASRHPSPDQLADGEVVVVRDPIDKWACFPCPCGYGETTKLSLNQIRRPRWQVRIDPLNRPTISPSVRLTSECLSHYWTKKGSVKTLARVRAPWVAQCAAQGGRIPAQAKASDVQRFDSEKPIWLPFLNTYRTMCIAPEPAFRQVLEEVRAGQLAA